MKLQITFLSILLLLTEPVKADDSQKADMSISVKKLACLSVGAGAGISWLSDCYQIGAMTAQCGFPYAINSRILRCILDWSTMAACYRGYQL
jgi:hypothetical protein